MNLTSTFHAQPGRIQFLVLDVVAAGKPFFAGLLIGNLQEGTATAVGSECLRMLGAAQDQCSNADQVMLVEIAAPERAEARIRKAASFINRHGAMALFCRDERCYDAAFEALNVQGKRQ